MKALFLTVILMAFCQLWQCTSKNKNRKRDETRNSKIRRTDKKEELQMVKTYPEKPAYYLQINKTGCRLLVRVDDIPIGLSFCRE